MDATWQYVGGNQWFFGRPVRGIVRIAAAEVFKEMTWWAWHAWPEGRGNGKPHLCGERLSRLLAIMAAEEALGLKE